MPSRKLNWSLAIFLSVTLAIPSLASHIRAAEIRVTRDNCSSLTVHIIITAYLNSHSSVAFGGEEDFLYFGDGTRHLVPETPSEIIDAELGVARVKYIATHTYSEAGLYIVSYSEPNRNFGVSNFAESGNTRFYTETAILLDPRICNTSPGLLVPPVDRACTGVKFFHNPGATDPDGDSLSYELVIPNREAGIAVSNYSFPDDEKFYSAAGISFDAANEEKNGPPKISIAEDGMITWDAPGAAGEYGIAIKVTEWRFNSGDSSWLATGYLIRDMQIIVEGCNNEKPELDVPEDFCVIAGTSIQLDIPARDADGHAVVIEAFSDVFSLVHSPAQWRPSDGAIQSTSPPHDTAAAHLVWQTTCDHVRVQPYEIIFKISDRPTSGPRLVQFYKLRINVIAPPPDYESVSINPVTKTATLQWSYSCDNVRSFQIWRRISEFPYEQPACDAGMPSFLRYQLLAEIPPADFNYTDRNLVFGAQYCYRIVALVGSQKLPSRISLDTCFIPKPAEAPVITHVSVQTTDEYTGEVLIRWTRPFDIDQQQYPPPYGYKVLRKIATGPGTSFEPITATTISDTLIIDREINTAENIFQYRVELYVPSLTSAALDTSSQASTVFVRSQPAINAIDISWTANTPWYNYAPSYPYHLIYRSDSPSGQFQLIDSVDVFENDFQYTDRGTFQNGGLTNKAYYYKVKTRGTYGNTKIDTPLDNFSQITSGQVLDTIPPCEPMPEVVRIDCTDFPCGGSAYYTKLIWQVAEGCDEDVSYEVICKDDDSDRYVSLGIVTGTEYLHTNLTSLNKCYRLISIDQAGNRSDTSMVACNSNCVNFALPNVITPETRDDQNDFLTTYPAGDLYKHDCARSVRQVDLKIYSRWGEEIFTTSITEGESPVFWNGLTNAGKFATSGLYFYHARVVFDTNDPSARNQQFKGWVHLIR